MCIGYIYCNSVEELICFFFVLLANLTRLWWPWVEWEVSFSWTPNSIIRRRNLISKNYHIHIGIFSILILICFLRILLQWEVLKGSNNFTARGEGRKKLAPIHNIFTENIGWDSNRLEGNNLFTLQFGANLPKIFLINKLKEFNFSLQEPSKNWSSSKSKLILSFFFLIFQHSLNICNRSNLKFFLIINCLGPIFVKLKNTHKKKET